MILSRLQVVNSGRSEPVFIATRFDDAVKYHVRFAGEEIGSVARFIDDRAYLGWYATPDDCTGGPNSSDAAHYRWAGGFRTRREAVAYLRGHVDAGSSWWAEAENGSDQS